MAGSQAGHFYCVLSRREYCRKKQQARIRGRE